MTDPHGEPDGPDGPNELGRARLAWPFVAALLAGAGFAAPALAQDEAERREAVIIVSVPGPQREAGELVAPVSVLDGAALQADLRASLGDSLVRLPGVASTSFGQGASRPVLRGLGAERVHVLTNGLGVIDASAASPDHQVAADGIDAVRIEIVRGPAALAYGGQAIGGVVNVIDGLTAEILPDRALSGALQGAYTESNDGAEGGVRLQGASGPVVLALAATKRDLGDYDIPGFAESAALRAAEAADGETSEEGAGIVENSFAETESLGGGVSLIGPNGFLGLAVRRQSALYGIPGKAHGGEAAEAPLIDLEQTRLDVRAGWTPDAGFVTSLKASAAFAGYEHTEFEAPGQAGTVFEAGGVEARVEAGHAFGGFEGLAGLQYTDGSLSAEGDEAFLTATDTRRIGAFLYEVREDASGSGVEGGLRLERVEHDNAIAGARAYDLVSASAGVHRHRGAWFAGVQLSYTERAPSPAELFADGPHLATGQFEIGDPGAGRESALTGEATARRDAGAWSFSAAAFLTRFDGFLYLAPLGIETDDLPVFELASDDADFIGAEVSLTYAPLTRFAGALWQGSAGLDVVSAELGDGENVPFLPPAELNLAAEADWARFRARLDLTLAATQDEQGAGQFETDGYATGDLLLAYKLPQGALQTGSELFVQIRNLGDAEVRYATSVLKDVAPQPGRSVRAGVRLAF